MRSGKTLRLFTLAMVLAFALPIFAQQKPFSQDQVTNMVRAGLGDDSGAKLIEQRGIDFAPAEDFLQSLKAAGASEAFLAALRAAKPPEPASANKPLHQVQILALLAGEVPNRRVAMLVTERGIDFDVKDDFLEEVRLGGGDDEVITALRSAKVTKPVTIDPAAQVRQTEVRQHMAHGAEFLRNKRYTDAEAEYRAAVRLDPQNADLHYSLGTALGWENDWDGDIQEEREAVRLNPNNDMAHYSLGVAFGHRSKWDDDMAEQREALRLNPQNANAHIELGVALGNKGDWDGVIAEEREALRLYPNNAFAHNNLGAALSWKGDWDGAIAEYREALRLNPNNAQAHLNLGLALGRNHDLDGEIAELREALRLDPNLPNAHQNLGDALTWKNDWDGATTEYREAVRLNPNSAAGHFGLGLGLERKGDRPGALEEYRKATTFDTKNSTYQQNYQRLLQQVNK